MPPERALEERPCPSAAPSFQGEWRSFTSRETTGDLGAQGHCEPRTRSSWWSVGRQGHMRSLLLMFHLDHLVDSTGLLIPMGCEDFYSDNRFGM